MARPEGSFRWRRPVVVLAVLLGGCTSFEVAVDEFDSVTRYGDAPTEPEAYELSRTPDRYPWVIRAMDGIALDELFKRVLSIEPGPTEVDDPPEFARERVEIMADRFSDLIEAAIAARRMLWVLELGSDQPRNQVVALRGLGAIAAKYGVDPLVMPRPDPTITTRDSVDAWFAVIQSSHPSVRGEALTDEQRASYLRTLREINEMPLPGKRNQRALIGALASASALEKDGSLVEPTREALIAAMGHGINNGLRDSLLAVVAPSPLVRLTAIQEIHRLGGSAAVPFILASIAKPATLTPAGASRFDADPVVRLSLVRMCGQLRGENALVTRGSGPAAVEFLYETHASDPDEGLRIVALEALAHALGRDVSFDPQWAERWWLDDYVPNRGDRQGAATP